MDQYSFAVSAEDAGERLDKYISFLLPDSSRTYLQKVVKDGLVLVNGRPAKPSLRLAEEDKIEITLPEPVLLTVEPENIPLDILYEDEDVLVVNKPKGMVVHPAAGHPDHTLVNAVMAHCGDSLSSINGVLRPGIVHRIDMDTTGSVIVCKNDRAHRMIAEQLREHSITRIYYAVVRGVIGQDELTVEGNIGRDPKDRKKMCVVGDGEGKHAVTHVKVLERFRGYTYVACRLETGRTHQIRVHLAWNNHPILGDPLYGRPAEDARDGFKALRGQCLHAGVLGFVHPSTGAYIETTAPLPEYFTNILDRLRIQNAL